ncbi:hypothetical protein D2C89_07625 [Helicobacter pylori]|nr:hypothetical protein D2C89_07625 [Helicobacter pylori]QEE98908.1 hypothetical protein D2C88_05985 [Helicobacter pylori]
MFSQIFKILGTYRVESNAFLVRLGSHSTVLCCYKPPTHIKILIRILEFFNQLPPFLGIKFRVKTPLTLFYFLNILVFPAF